MVTLVLLRSLLLRRSLCREEGNFIMIICKDFQPSELMIRGIIGLIMKVVSFVQLQRKLSDSLFEV